MLQLTKIALMFTLISSAGNSNFYSLCPQRRSYKSSCQCHQHFFINFLSRLSSATRYHHHASSTAVFQAPRERVQHQGQIRNDCRKCSDEQGEKANRHKNISQPILSNQDHKNNKPEGRYACRESSRAGECAAITTCRL